MDCVQDLKIGGGGGWRRLKQKKGSCGGERFVPATLINQEKPVEEEEEDRACSNASNKHPLEKTPLFYRSFSSFSHNFCPRLKTSCNIFSLFTTGK